MVYSAGQLDVPDSKVTGVWRMQLLWLGMSLFAMLILLRMQVRWLEWIAAPAYVLSLGLLAATLVIGTGAGTFAPQQRFAVGNNPRAVAVADVNGDGALDVMTANRTVGDSLSLLLQR